jgi:class 3 adenylate cyclase
MEDRRLAAIMFTDIVGYTALMQKSEERAVKMRDAHRKIFKSAHKRYQGKIIQYYGDGTLSIFNSAVQAVQCACEMQRQFQQEADVPVRIGIHQGDIILEKDDIIGDAVNLASRVESLGLAGNVLITDNIL